MPDKIHKTRGIVLRSVKYGETSLVVTIFTEIFGLQSYIVNGVRASTKKATGKITFTCNDGHLIHDAIARAIATGEGQTFWMKSIGTDEKGDKVSELDFEWSIKVKAS